MEAFLSTLPGVLDAIEASDEVRDAFVFAAWRIVAGSRTAERTSPIRVEGRTLTVAVGDKAWKRNLESLAPQLLYKLNSSLGKSLVDIIDFRVAPESIEFTPAEKAEPTPDAGPTPAELAISARAIRDEGLRRIVLTAAANCLARPN